MAIRKFERDAVSKCFADLTGQLEDAALIAAEGQGARSRDEARVHYNALSATVKRMSARLQQMKRQLT